MPTVSSHDTPGTVTGPSPWYARYARYAPQAGTPKWLPEAPGAEAAGGGGPGVPAAGHARRLRLGTPGARGVLDSPG